MSKMVKDACWEAVRRFHQGVGGASPPIYLFREPVQGNEFSAAWFTDVLFWDTKDFMSKFAVRMTHAIEILKSSDFVEPLVPDQEAWWRIKKDAR